jgi:hypothetical protein
MPLSNNTSLAKALSSLTLLSFNGITYNVSIECLSILIGAQKHIAILASKAHPHIINHHISCVQTKNNLQHAIFSFFGNYGYKGEW